jgi:WD40 repeat protein
LKFRSNRQAFFVERKKGLEMKVLRRICWVFCCCALMWQLGTSSPAAEGSHTYFSSGLALMTEGGLEAPEGSVRAELEQLQKRTGLAIGIFNYQGIGLLIFQKRSFAFHKLLFDGNATVGAVSRDGTEIALTQPLTKRSSVVIVHPDGSDLREYEGIRANSLMCWSYGNSELVVGTPGPKLQLLELKSKLVRELQVEDLSDEQILTSQCWSPDGKQIVYESRDQNVLLYNFEKNSPTKLAKGTEPTWSPDGNWIAYRDGDTYFAIHPSGEGRKKLFHKTRAVSGLYWSPDSRFVAYVHQDFLALDAEFYHLIVRRLEDGSEAWVADGAEAGAGYNYQWVANPQLLEQFESATASR